MAPKPVGSGDTGGESTVEEGFTQVRQPGRGSEARRIRSVVEMGGERARGGNNLRQSRKGQYSVNIPISNSFGRLEKDLEGPMIREETQQMEENKEINNTMNQTTQSMRDTQGKAIVFGTNLGKGLNGPQNGSKGKRPGINKDPDKTKPKTVNSRRPVRGLVFGPLRGEDELSTNGKRMRVEKENLGRGGYLVKSNTEKRGIENEAPVRGEDGVAPELERREAAISSQMVMHTGLEVEEKGSQDA